MAQYGCTATDATDIKEGLSGTSLLGAIEGMPPEVRGGVVLPWLSGAVCCGVVYVWCVVCGVWCAML